MIGGSAGSVADDDRYKMCLDFNVYDMKFTNFAPLENTRNEPGSFRINGFLYVLEIISMVFFDIYYNFNHKNLDSEGIDRLFLP